MYIKRPTELDRKPNKLAKTLKHTTITFERQVVKRSNRSETPYIVALTLAKHQRLGDQVQVRPAQECSNGWQGRGDPVHHLGRTYLVINGTLQGQREFRSAARKGSPRPHTQGVREPTPPRVATLFSCSPCDVVDGLPFFEKDNSFACSRARARSTCSRALFS